MFPKLNQYKQTTDDLSIKFPNKDIICSVVQADLQQEEDSVSRNLALERAYLIRDAVTQCMACVTGRSITADFIAHWSSEESCW